MFIHESYKFPSLQYLTHNLVQNFLSWHALIIENLAEIITNNAEHFAVFLNILIIFIHTGNVLINLISKP